MEPSVELYPHFEASSLQFSLNNIAFLPSYRLALVQYHPSSTFYHQTVARNEWKRRRLASLSRMEEGRVEKEEELRRLTRHKEQLDRASKRMVDSAVGTQERVYSQEDFAEKESEVREARREVSSLKTGLELEKSKRVSVEAKWRTDAARHRTEMAQILSKNAPIAISPTTQPSAAISAELSNRNFSSSADSLSTSSLPTPLASTSSPPNPPSGPSSNSAVAPGPTFSLIKHGRGTAISPDLQSLFTVIQVTNVPPSTTPLVVLYFLRRTVKTSATLPRPLALAKDNNRILLAFGNVQHAERAVNLLSDKIFPAVKGSGHGQKTRSSLTLSINYSFKHNELADEVRTSWLIRGELPAISEMQQVENLPGGNWSKEYGAEAEFIKGQSEGKETSGGQGGGGPHLALVERVKKRDRTETAREVREVVRAVPPHLVVAQQPRPIQALPHRVPPSTSTAPAPSYTGPAHPPPFYNPSYQFQSETLTPTYNLTPSFDFSAAPSPYFPNPHTNPLAYSSQYSTSGLRYFPANCQSAIKRP